jgi:hypothetical protein
MRPFGKHSEEQKISVPEPKTRIHPTRTSSLSVGRSSSADPPYALPTTSGQVVYADGQYQDRPTPGHESTGSSSRTGVQELAGVRAQLYVVQRRILEQIGKSMGYNIGWAAILSSHTQKEEFSDVDIDEKVDNEEGEEKREEISTKEEQDTTSPTLGLSAASLLEAISSIDQFRAFYEVGRVLLFDYRRLIHLTEIE